MIISSLKKMGFLLTLAALTCSQGAFANNTLDNSRSKHCDKHHHHKHERHDKCENKGHDKWDGKRDNWENKGHDKWDGMRDNWENKGHDKWDGMREDGENKWEDKGNEKWDWGKEECKSPINFCQKRLILERGERDWHTIVANLNSVFLAEALLGADATNPTIAALLAAVNVPATFGTITFAAQDFAALLACLGVETIFTDAVANAINAFALAAENYSGTVAVGAALAVQQAALQAWQTAGVNLDIALSNAIGCSTGGTILTLINQLIAAQVAVIQNLNLEPPNFPLAVQNNAVAHQVAEQLSDFVLKTLIRRINHCACPHNKDESCCDECIKCFDNCFLRNCDHKCDKCEHRCDHKCDHRCEHKCEHKCDHRCDHRVF